MDRRRARTAAAVRGPGGQHSQGTHCSPVQMDRVCMVMFPLGTRLMWPQSPSLFSVGPMWSGDHTQHLPQGHLVAVDAGLVP